MPHFAKLEISPAGEAFKYKQCRHGTVAMSLKSYGNLVLNRYIWLPFISTQSVLILIDIFSIERIFYFHSTQCDLPFSIEPLPFGDMILGSDF